jgi:hypothetical protein
LSEKLTQLLSQDFFPAQLEQAIALTEDVSWQAEEPLSLFVLGRVLRVISRLWNPDDEQDGPPESEYQAMLAQMRPAILAYLQLAATPATADIEYDRLNALVRTFLEWRASRG